MWCQGHLQIRLADAAHNDVVVLVVPPEKLHREPEGLQDGQGVGEPRGAGCCFRDDQNRSFAGTNAPGLADGAAGGSAQSARGGGGSWWQLLGVRSARGVSAGLAAPWGGEGGGGGRKKLRPDQYSGIFHLQVRGTTTYIPIFSSKNIPFPGLQGVIQVRYDM